jgi:hypothetical protein
MNRPHSTPGPPRWDLTSTGDRRGGERVKRLWPHCARRALPAQVGPTQTSTLNEVLWFRSRRVPWDALEFLCLFASPTERMWFRAGLIEGFIYEEMLGAVWSGYEDTYVIVRASTVMTDAEFREGWRDAHTDGRIFAPFRPSP